MNGPVVEQNPEDNLDAIKLRLSRQNETLLSLAKSHIGGADTLLEAIRQMNEASMHTLGTDRASVWFYTENRTNVHCVDLFDRATAAHSDGIDVKIATFPRFYSTFNKERTVAIEDTERDPRTEEFHRGYLSQYGVKSLLISAIWVDGAVAGLVSHTQTQYQRRWTLDESNFITCIASTIAHWMDIAERHAAEERLFGMQCSIDRASDGVLWVGPDAQIRYANQAASKMLGYTAEELMDRKLFDIAPRLASDAWARHWDSVKTRGAVTYETVQRTKSGAIVPVEVSLNHIQFRGQEYHCAFVRDITERKAAASEIESQRSFFRKVIDMNPNFIFAKDRSGRFVLVNQAVADAYGTSVNELIGKSDSDFNPNVQEVDHFRRDDLDVMDSGREKFVAEERITDAQGRVRYLQTVKKPIISANGRAEQLLGVSTDITDRKRYEEEQRRLVLQMQHAQKLESLGVLAGGIAHDFNNLLMGIIGNSALAEIELPEGSAVLRRVNQISTAAKRAAELTNQLLAYSGKGRFLVEQTDLSKVVAEMTTLLSTIVSKRAVLELDLRDELPRIEGDPGQLRQVVMNLITNASDAVDDHGGTISVRTAEIEATKQFLSRMYLNDELAPGRYVMLEVKDDGCGMSSETLTRIFDPFFTTKFTGRGLGLAAVLGIVRSHGGALRVSSEPGLGTAFTVIFPASDLRVQEPVPLQPEVIPVSGPRDGLFLVVDDEERTRSIIREMLEHYGYRVLIAENGIRAVELFREHADELTGVLLDLTMPKMNGEETWQELFQIRRDVPVILTSGYSEMEAADRFRGKAIAGFIQKPYHPDDLKKKIDELLPKAQCLRSVPQRNSLSA
ncbi:MAG: PAS domain S-box protein [Bdellovibrionota bacterium]